jgi:predicted Fe-Mo cluster-binding NifX family protein
VLVLRRKAIRVFPGNQRVATYRNDNLDLEVAIPYNPETLGRHKISTVGTAVAESLDEDTSDNLFGMYLKHAQSPTNIHDRSFKPHKHIETVIAKRYGEAALNHFKAAASHYMEGNSETANHHFAKFKRHAAELGEETLDESGNSTKILGRARSFADWKAMVHQHHGHQIEYRSYSHGVTLAHDAGIASKPRVGIYKTSYGAIPSRGVVHTPYHDLGEAVDTTTPKTLGKAHSMADWKAMVHQHHGHQIEYHTHSHGVTLAHDAGIASKPRVGIYKTSYGAVSAGGSVGGIVHTPYHDLGEAVDTTTPKTRFKAFKAKIEHPAITHGPQKHAIGKQMKALLTGEETLDEVKKHTFKVGDHVVFKRPEDSPGVMRVYHVSGAAIHCEHLQGPTKGSIRDYHHSLLKNHIDENTIVEATIHSLHTINKRKTPAMVKFGNGSAAMVHHETAARIMKLHSKVNSKNKRKIEGLVNSSPDGLKKVIEFAQVHLK